VNTDFPTESLHGRGKTVMSECLKVNADVPFAAASTCSHCHPTFGNQTPKAMIPLTRIIHGIAACGLLTLVAGCTASDSFQRLDANQNGTGSPEEFDAYMKQEVFTRVDANADGKVTLAEWQAVNPKVDAARFRKADRNGDGSISREEADAEFDREGSLSKLFKQIDTDGNGSLSQSEVTAFRKKVGQQPGETQMEKISNATKKP
jgi:hypothetical protein